MEDYEKIVDELRFKRDIPNLLNFIAECGDTWPLEYLHSTKVNVVQRTMNDKFQQDVEASDIPELVDLLIELAENRQKLEKIRNKVRVKN